MIVASLMSTDNYTRFVPFLIVVFWLFTHTKTINGSIFFVTFDTIIYLFPIIPLTIYFISYISLSAINN
jgi:hypothetical protein